MISMCFESVRTIGWLVNQDYKVISHDIVVLKGLNLLESLLDGVNQGYEVVSHEFDVFWAFESVQTTSWLSKPGGL